ncbi:hypothetical protein LTR84_005103 [Exophiala bonariae]|uniref:t-SNARE coiled-coil homology domain-containing protein n=1 Tax=Exophiala bonariae TaxID=1690606 RepID=A0AAV9NSR8_9EURO|nr:hypothetical protein LTR84_005103 [Exophiala bonariae]
MSLAAGLSPIGLSLRREHAPAKVTTGSVPFQHETNYLNLHRTLLRLQHLILLTPTPSSASHLGSNQQPQLSSLQAEIQAELWSPLPYGRDKWLQDIEGARTQLLQLERKAQAIPVQRAKYEALKDLAEKRALVKRLRNRVEEIGREIDLISPDASEPLHEDDGAETLYDILREHEQAKESKDQISGESEDNVLHDESHAQSPRKESDKHSAKDTGRQELFADSEVRRRGGKQDPSLDAGGARTTGFSNSQSTERLLLNSSRAHEDLTASLVSMAVQLKQQSKAMQFSLEQDKSLVDRALEGLDISLTGMAAASKNMAFLTRMSEEEGWFGRMKLYAMIFGMWIAAFLLVFVCPKLRF